MTVLKLGIWQDELPFDLVLSQLEQAGVLSVALKELGTKLIYVKEFEAYNLQPADSDTLPQLKEAFCKQFGIPNMDLLPKWLQMNQLTEAELDGELIYQERLARLKKLVVTPEALKEAFLKRKARLDTVTFALMRLDGEQLAKELYYRLCDDQQDFSALAKAYSSGPEAKFGGVIGPRPLAELNPELRNVLMTLKPNELAEPFSLDGKQFLIAKLLRADSATLTPALENTLRDELFEQWAQRQVRLANIQLIRQSASDAVTSEAL